MSIVEALKGVIPCLEANPGLSPAELIGRLGMVADIPQRHRPSFVRVGMKHLTEMVSLGWIVRDGDSLDCKLTVASIETRKRLATEMARQMVADGEADAETVEILRRIDEEAK